MMHGPCIHANELRVFLLRPLYFKPIFCTYFSDSVSLNMLLLFDLWNEIALILTTMAMTTERSATMIIQATSALLSVIIVGILRIVMVSIHSTGIHSATND